MHDALLIEAPLDRIDADVALLRDLMRRASRIVLNATVDGTHELRTDVTIIRYPDRYSDPRGAEIWTNVLRLLPQISTAQRRKERLMDDTPWHKRRLQELALTAPIKRKKTVAPFVKVPLRWITEAAKATRSPTTAVCIELLRASWKAGSPTVSLPNGRLKSLDVSREVKRRVLRDLERAGLIMVERRHGKTTIVTLIAN